MSINTQITVVATAEQIIVTAPGALRGPAGPAGPVGDVTPELSQLVVEAEAARDASEQGAAASIEAKDAAEQAASSAEAVIIPTTNQANIAKDAAERSESAASLAASFSNPFPSISEGLEKTSGSGPTNRFFSVPGAGDGLSVAYRNDAGSAVEIGSAASQSEVTDIASRLEGIEPGASRIEVDPSSGDLLVFTDGSADRVLLGRFDKNGYWRPEKHEPEVQDVLRAIAVFEGSDDLLRELDASEDQVLLRRVDRYGVHHGKWEGEFPARLENAGELAAAAFTAASEALVAVGSGPWGKLKQLMQTSFVHGLNPVQRPTLGLTALVTTTLPDGLSKAINVGRNPEAFAFIGGAPILSGTWYGFKAVTRLNGTGNLGGNNSGLQWSVEVIVDATSPAFRVLGNADEFRFIVDGQYYSDEVITVPGNGANCWIQLPFAKRAVRRIRICGTGRFGGVAVGPTESAWHPGDANRLRVSIIGDSYTDGTQSVGPDRSWTTQTAYLCGISNPWAIGLGGTGYISTGTGLGTFGSDARIADAIVSNPEILFFFGSVNDRQYTSAEIKAAAIATWRSYRTAFPDIPFVIIGCPTPATGIPAEAVKVDNALADAFSVWGDINADFVRVTTDPQGLWLFGTGYISNNPATSNGSGNNDVYMGRPTVNDGIHMNNAGHAFTGRRVAQALYQIAFSK